MCGRGGLTNNARGNIFFRHLCKLKQDEYLKATKREKAGVAREIVQAIKALNPPGRFLKKTPKGEWEEISDRKAREKTSQALREGAPEKRNNTSQGQTNSPGGSIINKSTLPVAPTTTPPQTIHLVDGQVVSSPAPPPPVVVAPIYYHEQQQEQQDQSPLLLKTASSADPWAFAASNRARVVSDDSVGIQASLYDFEQQQQAVGSKRKALSSEEGAVNKKRGGPRLKLFKSRLMA